MEIERVNVVINYDMPEDLDAYFRQVGLAVSFGTKGLAITYVADDKGVAILKKVQTDFEVQVTEMPDEIDFTAYIKNHSLSVHLKQKCGNGEDEYYCSDQRCPLGTHACISPTNYSFSCLSSERVNDKIDDCLGESDEPHYCRELYPLKQDYEGFHCSQSDLCLSVRELGDNIPSCPLGDNEKIFELKRSRIVHFSIRTSADYPQTKSLITNPIIPLLEEKSYSKIKTIESRINSYSSSSSWSCNRGLNIRIWLGDDHYKDGCLCPPSYYGDLCQYQNQRISLTLGIRTNEKQLIYTIVIKLLDENDQQRTIESYDQFDYTSSQSCGMKFNRYLIYPIRTKNLSKIYYLHLDIFEKNSMIYRGSWFLLIPFLFLPVNRLVIQLTLSYSSFSISSNCTEKCINVECIRYINQDKYFCRCYSGWSGIRCDIPINCQYCSQDSICIGSIHNRSICVCPLTKFGPRCLLKSSCEMNACENNGQCIPADLSEPGSEYTCICSEEYFGNRCQYSRAKLEIVLENLDILSYLIAFFLTISNQSEPTSTIMLEKLRW
ncbi:hypothetical protein I4U23_026838 [Adineta vaga]|nr:hypothetical protein I4U23_026838 [Adineta vaga]